MEELLWLGILCLFLQAWAQSDLSKTAAICGLRFNAQGSRVIGGKEAESGETPWQVMFRRNGQQYCGGSIISTQWILTAAHCLRDPFPRDVIAGSLTRQSSHLATQHDIVEEIIHPGFNYDRLTADIALVRVNPPLAYRLSSSVDENSIAPVCLYGKNQVPRTDAVISGYGKLGANGVLPKKLMVANVTILSDEICENIYTNIRKYNRETMICAGKRNGRKDTCAGDSGGPLTILENNRIFQVGIVSFGKACGKNFPGIYTKVPAYMEWITQVTSVEPLL